MEAAAADGNSADVNYKNESQFATHLKKQEASSRFALTASQDTGRWAVLLADFHEMSLTYDVLCRNSEKFRIIF